MQSQAVGLDAVETGKLAKKQLREGVKKRVFYSQADPKGGGGGVTAASLAVSKCENFYNFEILGDW